MAKPSKEDEDNHKRNNDAAKKSKEEVQAEIKTWREAQEKKDKK